MPPIHSTRTRDAEKRFTTLLYLADALLEHFPDQEQEARDLLNDLVQLEPDPAYVVEQTQVIEDAKALLASLDN